MITEDYDLKPFPNVGNNPFYSEFSVANMLPQIPLTGKVASKDNSEDIEDEEEFIPIEEAGYSNPIALYHGSNQKVSVLKPYVSSHGKPYVYGTPDYNFALCYAGDQWHDFEINQCYYNDKLYLIEIQPGMFDKKFNRPGYVYKLPIREFKPLEYKAIRKHIEWICTKEVIPEETIEIENVLEALKESGVVLYKYLQLPRFMSSHEDYIKKKTSSLIDLTNDLSIKDYVSRTFPNITLEKKIERINDKGKPVPDKCPKCGSDIGIFLRGEPVWLCKNKNCHKYFGTVPCTLDENVNEFTIAQNIWYHLVPKGIDMRLGLLSLEYMYNHRMYNLFDKYTDKYRDRLCGAWDIYRGKDPELLSREDVYNGLIQARGMNGCKQIYLFKFPPYPELGPNMKKVLDGKDVYAVNLSEIPDIIDIDYGYINSNKELGKIDPEYYKDITPSEYFKNYKDNAKLLFSTINHISITTRSGKIPPKSLKKIDVDSNINMSESTQNFFMENWIIPEPDLKINFEKWGPGNPLYITGASGDGKSTLAQQLAKEHNAEIVSSDIVLIYLSSSKEKLQKSIEAHKISIENSPALDYLKLHPELPTNQRDPITKKWNDDIIIPEMIKFYLWFMKESSINPRYNKRKFIVEGCDICLLDPSIMATKPLIIMGGNRLRNLYRRAKRDSLEKSDRNIIQSLFKYIKNYNGKNRSLDDNKESFRSAIMAMQEATTLKRSELPDKVFGIPELRKYPMPDKKHVISAAKLFNHCDEKYEEELADNIISKAKKFKVDLSFVSEKNRLYKYLHEPDESIKETTSYYPSSDDVLENLYNCYFW